MMRYCLQISTWVYGLLVELQQPTIRKGTSQERYPVVFLLWDFVIDFDLEVSYVIIMKYSWSDCRFSLYRSPPCHTSLKAFCMITKFSLILLMILWHCWVIAWCSRKPKWYGKIKLSSRIVSFNLFIKSMSYTFDITSRRLIGLFELFSVGGFPDLAMMIMTCANFHYAGK